MCRKGTMDTAKSPRAKGVCEPPEVQGEHSAKSRLAKQENPRAGWAGRNLKTPPPPTMGRDNFHQSRVLQPGLEKFQGWGNQSLPGQVMDEQAEFGSSHFPARLWLPEQGQEWFPAGTLRGICGLGTPVEFPGSRARLDVRGADLRWFLAVSAAGRCPSCPAQLWDALSSPQLMHCVPAIPWQIFLAGMMVGIAVLPSPPVPLVW